MTGTQADYPMEREITLSQERLREKILLAERELLRHPQVALETVHHFAEGLYARELRIPKDTILTGAVHRQEHLNIVSMGRIAVFTEDGMREVSAPCHLVSRPGTKRIGWTLEDTVWTTIHANPTGERDVAKIWDLFTEPSAVLAGPEEVECLSK